MKTVKVVLGLQTDGMWSYVIKFYLDDAVQATAFGWAASEKKAFKQSRRDSKHSGFKGYEITDVEIHRRQGFKGFAVK